MSAYQRALDLQDDFRLELLAFTASVRAMAEINAEIKQRQKAEQAAAETRRDELTATAEDETRPASVRRLAEAELASLPEYCPQITEAEAAAFNEERQTAEEALADLHRTVEALKEATTEAKKELDRIRAETAGAAYFDVWRNWLQNAEKDFSALE